LVLLIVWRSRRPSPFPYTTLFRSSSVSSSVAFDPGVGVDGRPLQGNREAALGELRFELSGREVQPHGLRGPVRDVDELGPSVAAVRGVACLGGGMMAQIGGDVDLRTAGADLVEEGISGPAADGHSGDRRGRVTGDAH